MSDEVRTDSRLVEVPSGPAPAVGLWSSITLLLTLLVVCAGYAWHEHDVVRRLATQNSDATSALDATRGQVADLTTKLNDLAAQSNAHPVRTQATSRPSAARRTNHDH